METNPLDPSLAARGPGDVDAWLRHATDVRRLARRLVRDDASADDLTQDAWLGALERTSTSEPPQGWRRWLFGVARNVAREGRRGSARRARREQEVARSEALAPESTPLERIETIERLARELAALPEPYRETLVRRYVDGLSFAEIGARTGASEGTVRSRHARGLALLRERLDRSHPGGRAEWMAAFLALDVPESALPHASANGLRLAAVGTVAAALVLVATFVLVPRGSTRADLEDPDGLGVRAAATDARDLGTRRSLEPPADGRAIERRAALATGSASAPTPASAEADARVALELVVVDERLGFPLRDYHVRLGIPGAPELPTIDARTDAAGRVLVERVPRMGPVSLTLIDDARLDELRRAASGSRAFPWTISVPYDAGEAASVRVSARASVGPTVRLAPRFAPGNAEGLGPADLAALLYDAWVDLEGEDPVDPPRRAVAPVRDAASATPFVRFGADAPRADETSRRRLVLTSADGAWSGSAWLAPEIDDLVDRGHADEGPIVELALARVGDARTPAALQSERLTAARGSAAPEPAVAPWAQRGRTEPSRTLKIRAIDAATGARIDAFAARLELDGDPNASATRSTTYGNLDFRDVPLDARVRYVVSARGYRPLQGTRADFVPDTDHDVAIVRLVRGWQRTFVVTEVNGTLPIEGAFVVVDGERVGATDARGELIVTRDTCPTRVEVLRGDSRGVRAGVLATEPAGTVARYLFENE